MQSIIEMHKIFKVIKITFKKQNVCQLKFLKFFLLLKKNVTKINLSSSCDVMEIIILIWRFEMGGPLKTKNFSIII